MKNEKRTVEIGVSESLKPEMYLELVEWTDGRRSVKHRQNVTTELHIVSVSRNWIGSGIIDRKVS